MKRMFALLFALIIANTSTALAAKARSIGSDADSSFHAKHLALHIGESSCHATGNYIKTRSQSNKDKVIGHLEQADVFELLEVKNGYALIQVTSSHKTSPDSWEGMTGWVDSDYIDCTCSSSEYANQSSAPANSSTSSKIEDFIGTSSVVCTGNNLRVRNKPNGKTILGHLEKADEFILLDVQNGWAQITVTKAASTSPDSWNGLSGWVSAEYLKVNKNAQVIPDAGDGYTPILDFFYQAIAEKWDNDRIAAADFEPYEFPDNLNDSGFVYWDINADGTDELFVFRSYDAEIGPVIAGYTLVNGHPVRLFSSWARSRNYLCADGSIYNEGSNGASYSVYYVYDLIGSHLKVREGVLSGDYEEDGETKYGWFLVDERADFSYAEHMLISDEEADQRIALYQSAIISNFDNFTPFSQYNKASQQPIHPTKTPQNTFSLPTITPAPTPSNGFSSGRILLEEDSRWSTNPYSPTLNVKIPSKGGYFSFRIPENATNLHLNDTHLTFSISTEWLQIDYSYEIVSGIDSAPQAELMIKSITDTLPYSLSSAYSGLYTLQDLKEHLYPSQFEYYSEKQDIRNVWFDGVTSTGAAYFYESCDYTNQDDMVFDKLITESYNYGGGIAIHETIEVVYLNFKDYYDSLETRIEKNNADSEFASALYHNKVEMLYHQEDAYSHSVSSCASAMHGINMCLLKDVQVFAN